MEGLSGQEAQKQLEIYGLNEITEKKSGAFLKFAKWLVSPIALMLLTAALLSLLAKNTFDFWFILVLMLLNFFISFWQENKADRAVKKLQEKLSVEIPALRDGKWQPLTAKYLVPGDVVKLGVGDVIPADAKILHADNLTANEAQSTGESLPKEKNTGDFLISGSFITTGLVIAQVTATGKNTGFGKTLTLAQNTKKRSLLEQDILRISKFLSILSLIAVVILTAVLAAAHTSWLEIILLDLSLIIAGIPISLPTVMSLIIGFGVLELAKEQAIVRKLNALEDFANVDLLLSDKTGTLTQNKISVEKIISYNSQFLESDLIKFAIATSSQDKNPINQAIMGKFRELGLKNDYQIIKIIPGDSLRKRSTAIIKSSDSRQMCVTVGATQVVETLCDLEGELAGKFKKDISGFASLGYRSLAVAINMNGEKEEHMKLAGLLLLSDTIFADAKEAINFLKINGIAVKMLTGDNAAISRRVAQELMLDGADKTVVDRQALSQVELFDMGKPWWQNKVVFAEILPEDKLKITQAAKKFFRVAVTGDGVNDLPAIKAADVGIAVAGAADALKSAADIVLLVPGIAVIKTAVTEARKIFARLYSYSVYRLSESLRLIVTIAVLGVIYKTYPLTPVQLILLAFLNDLPIISLAFNRVAASSRPSEIKVKQRFWLSGLFGLTGVINSLLMFYLTLNVFHLSLPVIETLFFLKLTVGGHMLIYVAHTKERWDKFLPSRPVILATSITQILATTISLSGWFMPKAPLVWVVLIWIWAFLWMQVSELVKHLQKQFIKEGV